MTQTLILHNLPVKENLELSIDNSIWKIGTKFKGFKDIPTGLHLISFIYQNSKMGAIPVSKFIFVQKNSFQILEFDNESMELNHMSNKNPLIEMYVNASELNDLKAYLATYKVENYELWRLITTKVTEKLMNKVLKSASEPKSQSDQKDIPQEEEISDFNQEEVQNTQNLSEKEDLNNALLEEIATTNMYNFAKISTKSKDLPKAFYLDRSEQLKSVLRFEFDCLDINLLLGEFQIGFIIFTMLENPDGLKIWQEIVFLFCESEMFMKTNFDEYSEFLAVFFVMLKQLPSDFFYHELTKSNCLVQSLQHLMENLQTNVEYLRFYNAYQSLMRVHFNFDCSVIVFDKDSKKMHLNELLLGDELPVLVDDEPVRYISFD